MKRMLWALLFFWPLISFGQNAISLSGSYVINEDFSLWRSGFGFERDLQKLPLTFSVGINSIKTNRLDYSGYTPIPELQSDTTFGLWLHNFEHYENDVRLGFYWRHEMSQVDLLVGVEGIIGLSNVALTEAMAKYLFDPGSGKYVSNVASTGEVPILPIDVVGYATDQEFRKMGFAPSFGMRYHFTDKFTAGFAFKSEFARRTMIGEIHSLEGPVSNDPLTLQRIKPSLLFEWKMTYRFMEQSTHEEEPE